MILSKWVAFFCSCSAIETKVLFLYIALDANKLGFYCVERKSILEPSPFHPNFFFCLLALIHDTLEQLSLFSMGVSSSASRKNYPKMLSLYN